jgi:hypothetical protein
MTARRKREWFEDDSFWRDLYPYMFPKTRLADAIKDAGLEQVGFVDVRLYGGLRGEEYGLNAQRLIAVARRVGEDSANHLREMRGPPRA